MGGSSAAEVRLERLHARGREQHRRVVDRGHERAEGKRRWPRPSKNDRNRSRISAAVMALESKDRPATTLAAAGRDKPAIYVQFRRARGIAVRNSCNSYAAPPDSWGAWTMGRYAGRAARRGGACAPPPWNEPARAPSAGRVRRAVPLAAVAIAVFLPSEREFQPLLWSGSSPAYALISRVRFEVGDLVRRTGVARIRSARTARPAPVRAAARGARVRAVGAARAHQRQLAQGAVRQPCLSDCWFAIGPVLVLAWLAPGEPRSLSHFGAYVAAFSAQFAFDATWRPARPARDQIPHRTSIENYVGIFRFDAILTSIAFVITPAGGQTSRSSC